MMLALILAAWAVAHTGLPLSGGPDRLAWIVVLLVQSVPYACSLLLSLLSASGLPARLLGTGYRTVASAARQPEADLSG